MKAHTQTAHGEDKLQNTADGKIWTFYLVCEQEAKKSIP